MASTEPAAVIVPKKKLPFKRTVARKPLGDAPSTEKEPENDLDFFRRSKEVIPLVLDEVEKSFEREKTSSPQSHERKRKRPSLDKQDDGVSERKASRSMLREASMKKEPRRLSDNSSDDLIMDVKGKGKEIIRAVKTPSPRKPAVRSIDKAPTRFFDSDDDSDFFAPRSARKVSSASHPSPRNTRSGVNNAPVKIDEDDDDIEVLESKPNIEEQEDLGAAIQDIDSPDEYSSWVTKAKELGNRNPDVAINIMVTSKMENTVPMMVKRKLGQGMKLVLDTWAARQRAHGTRIAGDNAGLFLTWKKKKVYDYSTAASLGVQVGEDGRLVGDASDGFRNGGIHLEVWTDDLYSNYIRQKERERALHLGLSDSEEEREPTPPLSPKKKGIRVVLKAKEFEPLKVTIDDDMTVEKLVSTFRSQRPVAPGRNVSIYFDGEKLDDDSLVTDADIDPDDANQFEVHIK